MAHDISAQSGLANSRRRPVTGSGRTNTLLALFPAVALFYAAMAPYEMRLDIAGQTLYAYRIVAFGVLPFLALNLVREPLRWVLLDYVFASGSAWMVFAFIMYYGPADGAASGISRALDVILPYLVGRICIRDSTDLRRFLILVAPGVGLAAMTLVLEVLAGDVLVRRAAASVFGARQQFESGVAVGEREYVAISRIGIIRAVGPFPHPILAGLFLSVFFPLYFSSGIRGWPRFVGVIGSFAAILTVSSTALVILIISFGALAFDRIQKSIAFLSWRMALPVGIALFFVLDVIASKGIVNVLSRYSLDPQTARYRTLIWKYGSESVAKHPWFGIGYDGYERLPWMVESVDNNWLNLAIRHGLVPAVAFLVVSIGAVLLVSRSSMLTDEIDRRLHVAVAIALAAMIIAGSVVAFFGGAQTWMYMLIAIGVSIGVSSPRHAPLVARPKPLQLRSRQLGR
ncbi:MAG: O-antigen ligase family protein [Erythrobacter sp.]|uniref:O-antigen ligase family protein n=1 Tax=Erythrobacter sp. TaxID=1042 RepID=UPI0032EAED8B